MHGLLIGGSMLLAARTGHPEIALTDEETAGWLVSAQNLARHYSIEATQKTIDMVAFFAATASVFGTRLLTVVAKETGARRQRAPSVGVPVVQMDGTPFIQPDENSSTPETP